MSESPQRPGVKVLQLATYNVSFVDEFFSLHLLTLPLIVAFLAPPSMQCKDQVPGPYYQRRARMQGENGAQDEGRGMQLAHSECCWCFSCCADSISHSRNGVACCPFLFFSLISSLSRLFLSSCSGTLWTFSLSTNRLLPTTPLFPNPPLLPNKRQTQTPLYYLQQFTSLFPNTDTVSDAKLPSHCTAAQALLQWLVYGRHLISPSRKSLSLLDRRHAPEAKPERGQREQQSPG